MLPKRILIDIANTCNLRCPMCEVWGRGEDKIKSMSGAMTWEQFTNLVDQLPEGTLIQPNLWAEPTLMPEFKRAMGYLKDRGLRVSINTNGLTLTKELCNYLVAINLDSVSISIDATTRETLRKVRGIDRLEKIEAAVFRLLACRGDKLYPRVGVSFTVQDANRHERERFLERWVNAVDVVRIGLVFAGGAFPELRPDRERIPCPLIYETLPINNDGSAGICCLDTKNTNLGNVFEHGIEAVWSGAGFQAVRLAHEEGRWDDVPFCKNCNGWAMHTYTEEITDNILIRRSPEFAYYNRMDKMQNWRPS